MRYVNLYNRIKEASPVESVILANLRDSGEWGMLRERMDRLDVYIPTNYPLVDALVNAHSPVIDYKATKVPNTTRDGLRQKTWISLPPPQAFASPEAYARVVVHELSHWVKWVDPDIRINKLKARANDLPPASFEDLLAENIGMSPQGPYALEELTAETTAFLVITKVAPEIPVQPMVDYLKVWGNNLKDAGYDDGAIEKLYAIAQDQALEAASYLLRPLNLTPMETS